MTAPELWDVMQGVAARLLTIQNLNVSTAMPEQVTAPHACVGVPPVTEYHSTMARGLFSLAPTITVFTSIGDGYNGQLLMSKLASPTGDWSIRSAIEGDRTLGGVVSDCVVMSFEPQGLEDVGGQQFYVGVFTLQCIAPGA